MKGAPFIQLVANYIFLTARVSDHESLSLRNRLVVPHSTRLARRYQRSEVYEVELMEGMQTRLIDEERVAYRLGR